MAKKAILFLFYRECTFLPPFMTILDALCDIYSLKVISCENDNGRDNLRKTYDGRDVTFLSKCTQDESRTVKAKWKHGVNRLTHRKSKYHKEAVHFLSEIRYDLLWVIHEETLYEFREAIVGKKYVASLYELNDHRRDFLEIIKPTIQNALEVIVPEYNRACILRVWLNLKRKPTVIPNKPLNHPLKKNMPNPYSAQFEGKKIILYQGYIQRSRNIDALCEACKDMPDYTIVIMGGGDYSYINELKRKYPQVLHISHVAPPNHLYITSYAHIAIVKYDFVCLNAIFCAPNKTWEYTGFGIPVLCHNIPGLEYTIGKYAAGICTDMDDVKSIKEAVAMIDIQYDYYSQNAILFYDSFDINASLHRIVNRNIQ